MSIVKSIRNLFIEPALFFENYTKRGLGIPILITLVYAVLAAACAYFTFMQTSSVLPVEIPGVSAQEMMPVLAGGAAASAFFTAVIAWIAMSILFLIALKLFCKQPAGKTPLRFKDILHITAYGAFPLALSAIIEMLISFTGAPNSWATLILSAAVLFLTIPIWVKGFENIGAGPEKKVLTAVIAACVIPALFTVITVVMA